MREIYRSRDYRPELVTGRYVRCDGRKQNYVFRVFECETRVGAFAGQSGMGGTLREYDCDGSELPTELRDRAIASKQTERWD